MREIVKTAFLAVRQGFPPDRIVADPGLNDAFLRECRRLGLSSSPRELNQSLLNLRKVGLLPGLKSRRTSFGDRDEYAFASEIAVRFLERRDGLNLDQIICDPSVAREFDAIAARIAPGYDRLRYRWAALRLRKARQLRPEPIGQVVRPIEVLHASVSDLDVERLPLAPGIYLFHEPTRALYVGETRNLRGRIRRHLDHSDNKGLARWIWDEGVTKLMLEVQVLLPGVTTKVRKAMEQEMITSRRPLFNVLGTT